MDGSDIPYQLRPNKFIDRQLFIELLGRLVSIIGVERYVYVSMGGKHLVDHAAVYRQLGIPHLFSIENNQRIVDRQIFNRPIDRAVCSEMESASLPAEIDAIFDVFPKATNLIVWLDYTSPNARLTQLQEMIELLKRLQANDILRITLNASLGTLEEGADWKAEGHGSPQEFRLARLKKDLGDLVPTDLPPIGQRGFAPALARCVQLAVSRAEMEIEDVRFEPLLITTYKDGQRMMTAAIRAKSTPQKAVDYPALKGWPFKATDWSKMIWIEAPDLSMREKLRIDQYINRSPSYILERLNFLPAKDRTKSLDAIKSYKKLHRYYPEFRNVEA